MNVKIYFLFLFFICAQDAIHAQEKYSKVAIPVGNEEIRNFIWQQLHADHFEQSDSVITLTINSGELLLLHNSGYSYTLLVDDVVQQTILENRLSSVLPQPVWQNNDCKELEAIIAVPQTFGTGGSLKLGAAATQPGYFTYAEMIAAMQNLQLLYPSLIQVFSLGSSANGTTIYAVKISDNVAVDEAEPEILYTGLQHAREAIGGTSLIFFMQYLIENYSTDSRIQELVNNRAFYIVPCVNPDGYAYNYSGVGPSYPVTGGGLWRKNRRHTGGAPANIGVDLNRNYGVDWANCSGASVSCGSSVKTDDTYFGPAAFSEPETQAVRNLVLSHKFINAIDQHCYGAYYSLPYGRPTLHPPLSNTDAAYYTGIPAAMGLYNGHRAGNSPQTVAYEVAGGIKDWLLLGDIGSGSGPKAKIYGMTGEAGGGNFWAPVSQIYSLCRELTFQNLQLAFAAGDLFSITDLDGPSFQTLTGVCHFQLRKTGLGNQPVRVRLIPLENMQSAGLPVTHVLNNYDDVVYDSIAFQLPANYQSGQRIKYVWEWQSGGINHYDTITRFLNPITLFTDNMEGTFSGNWTAAINPSGPMGWSYSATQAYQQSHSLTESPSGNYTSGSTRTVTCNAAINLSDAQDARLYFWVKHQAENFRDKLQVQFSTDGSSWAPVCGSITVSAGNLTNGGTLGSLPALTGIRPHWTPAFFDLKDFLGFSSVRFRFQFTSDNDAGSFAFEKDDGFYIDELKLIKVSSISTLATGATNFTARLSHDGNVWLNWATSHRDEDAYDVPEKMDHNGVYQQMGKKYTGNFSHAIDLLPQAGNHYYRIATVAKNGAKKYSEISSVTVSGIGNKMLVYPNPVSANMYLHFSNPIQGAMYQIRIYNTNGQCIYHKPIKTSPGSTSYQMNIDFLPPQLYLVCIENAFGALMYKTTIVKN